VSVQLVPVGPGIPAGLAAILKSHEDALRSLMQPGSPVKLPHIDTKAHLLAQAPPANWPECGIVCDEINALCVSTQVAGTWTWLRADGSAL
jgi:hypothetical protein